MSGNEKEEEKDADPVEICVRWKGELGGEGLW